MLCLNSDNFQLNFILVEIKEEKDKDYKTSLVTKTAMDDSHFLLVLKT
jgi:hypothetical protein